MDTGRQERQILKKVKIVMVFSQHKIFVVFHVLASISIRMVISKKANRPNCILRGQLAVAVLDNSRQNIDNWPTWMYITAKRTSKNLIGVVNKDMEYDQRTSHGQLGRGARKLAIHVPEP